MRLDPSDLDLPARTGIRTILRAHLRESLRELARLERAADEEALHDFRVSLRRLRSLARALSSRIPGELRRKQLRRLRDYATATGAARDAEVFLGLLAGLRGGLAPREVPALDWLAARLLEQAGGGHGEVAQDRLGGFRKLARALYQELAAAREADEAARRGPTLGRALAECIAPQATELLGALAEVRRPFDVELAHEARIAAKRLRYLLEPLRGCARADGSPAIAVLKELQDRLGEMHDAHVLGEAIQGALLGRAEERVRHAHAETLSGGLDAAVLRSATRDPLARGLLVLDARVADRATRSFARLQSDWLPRRRQELVEAVAGLCAGLSRPDPGGATGRRTFLLLRVPEGLEAEPARQVELGWLPGGPPRSLLLREQGPGGPRWLLLGAGSGAVAQPLTQAQFAERWPETLHARLACARRDVLRGGRQWTVDAIEPGGPIVAETAVEPGEELRIPRWLAKALVREVTGERAYQLERLAARRSRPSSTPPGPAPPDPAPSVHAAGTEGATSPHLVDTGDLTTGDGSETGPQTLAPGPGQD